MTQATEAAVRTAVTVEASADRAFALFTEGMTGWWPLETHRIGAQPAEAAVLEPRVGGRWFERAADGSECDWGRVLAWEPPRRVLLAWHLASDWRFDPDPAHASEIEVTFVPEDGRTRVTLVHRAFERHGADAESIRSSVGSEGGWPGILARYAGAAQG
jgi:uncharacterized protein YndB with AHSA1/START domain